MEMNYKRKPIQHTLQEVFSVATEYVSFFFYSFNISKHSISIVKRLTLTEQLGNKRLSLKQKVFQLIDSQAERLYYELVNLDRKEG